MLDQAKISYLNEKIHYSIRLAYDMYLRMTREDENEEDIIDMIIWSISSELESIVTYLGVEDRASTWSKNAIINKIKETDRQIIKETVNASKVNKVYIVKITDEEFKDIVESNLLVNYEDTDKDPIIEANASLASMGLEAINLIEKIIKKAEGK